MKTTFTIDNVLTQKEYRQLTFNEKKEYQKNYQILLNEYRIREISARDLMPSKVQYYKYQIIFLLNNAPVSVI